MAIISYSLQTKTPTTLCRQWGPNILSCRQLICDKGISTNDEFVENIILQGRPELYHANECYFAQISHTVNLELVYLP